VLLQGEIEALGESIRGNGAMFFPAGASHGIRNTGHITAMYLVFEFHHRAAARAAVTSARPAEEQVAQRPARAANRTLASVGDPEAWPIFVMGCGRSGTTLVQRVINAAPDTAISGEHNGFLGPLAEAYYLQREKGCARLTSPGDDFQSEIRRRLKDPTVWPGWTNAYRQEDLAGRYAELIAGCLGPDWIGERRWGFKEIRYGKGDRVIEMLMDVFPNGRFVFVARNPVDVIASQRLCAFGELELLLDDWLSKNETFSSYAEDCPDRCLLVRHERLVGSPRETVEAMYDWLGLQEASAGSAVVDLAEGRYEMRPRGRLPRELLTEKQLRRIFIGASRLAAKLELPMPVLPTQAEAVAFKLSSNGARIGPFADGRLIQCDAVALGLWSLCNGGRDIDTIISEMSAVAGADDVRAMLEYLLNVNGIALRPVAGEQAQD
jgi:hypothetical protein